MNKALVGIIVLSLVVMAGCIGGGDDEKSLKDFFEETVSNALSTDDGKFETKIWQKDNYHFFIVGKVVETADVEDVYSASRGTIDLVKIEFEDEVTLEVRREYLYKDNAVNGFSVKQHRDACGREHLYVAKVVF